MAISIGSTQFGRDTSGVNKLDGDIGTAFNNYNKVIQDITDIKNVVKKNWAGVDADDFIKTLETKAKGAVQTNKMSVSKIQSAIHRSVSDFNKMQSSNTGIIR